MRERPYVSRVLPGEEDRPPRANEAVTEPILGKRGVFSVALAGEHAVTVFVEGAAHAYDDVARVTVAFSADEAERLGLLLIRTATIARVANREQVDVDG